MSGVRVPRREGKELDRTLPQFGGCMDASYPRRGDTTAIPRRREHLTPPPEPEKSCPPAALPAGDRGVRSHLRLECPLGQLSYWPELPRRCRFIGVKTGVELHGGPLVSLCHEDYRPGNIAVWPNLGAVEKAVFARRGSVYLPTKHDAVV